MTHNRVMTHNRAWLLPFLVLANACQITSGRGNEEDVTHDVGTWPMVCVQSGPPGESLCASTARPDEFAMGDYATSDFGRTWVAAAKLPHTSAGVTLQSDLTPCPTGGLYHRADAGDGRLYDFDNEGVRRTDDAGTTWRRLALPAGLAYNAWPVRGVAARGARVVLHHQSQAWKADDAGVTWQPMQVLGSYEIADVGVGPGKRLAVQRFTEPPRFSDDDGKTWRSASVVPFARMAVARDGDVWLWNEAQVVKETHADLGGVLWRSRDWGRTFSKGKLAFGGMDWTVHYGPTAAEGYLGILGGIALGDGQFAFTAKALPGKAARSPLACFVGRTLGQTPPALPTVPPAATPPGTMQPFAWDQPAPNGEGRLVVLPEATWVLHRKQGTLGPLGSTAVHDTQMPDPYASCNEKQLGAKGTFEDLDLDAKTGDLYALIDVPKHFPDLAGATNVQCLANLDPRGPVLAKLPRAGGQAASQELVGPVACSSSGAVINPYLGCGNKSCSDSDKIVCPEDCAIKLCGNGKCDAWEQLHCAQDCKGAPYFSGTCGNLTCDDAFFEAIFCASDCAPKLPRCPTNSSKGQPYPNTMARPWRLFAPEWVVLQTGLYRMPVNAQSKPQLAPFQVGAWHPAADVFYVPDKGWLKRRVPGKGDPCADPATTESADCIPLPKGDVSDVAIGADGQLYVLAKSAGQVLRRPLTAAQAPWQLVIDKLWAPQDMWLDGGTGADKPTRVFVLDGDVWVGVPGAKLPLVRALL